jgi:hypothetical protein
MVCTVIWLDSLEMLLESRALSDVQLNALTPRLKEAEKQVPVMHERAIYGEAVMNLDLFEMLAIIPKTGIEKFDNSARWRDFRYFVPQLWWYAALDKANIARTFMVSDFSEMPEQSDIGRPLLFSSMLLPPNAVGKEFHGLTARLRAMQALITAEQHRRRHGDWPEQLENLPEDPFTGEPLRYRHGDCVLRVNIAKWDEVARHWRIETQQRSAAAVQVWSVGPDKINDNGLRSTEPTDGRHPDDIRAILRLQLPQL